MTWFKVDDSLAFHAKTVQAGNAAMGLWVRAGSWSAQQLTDGRVPDHIVNALGTVAQAKRLESARLWIRDSNGYLFHGWNDDGRQPTREKVEQDRAEAKERMRKNREARRKGSPEQDAKSARTSGEVRASRPDPSRPDPSSTYEGGSLADRDTRDPNEPPRCPQHKGWRREDVPDCWACGHKREQWEAQRTADEVFERPAWCGDCDEWTRLVETDDGMARCQTCHPLAVAS